MEVMIAAALALAALHAAAPDAMPVVPPGTMLSWEQANSLARKLEDIEKRRMEKRSKPQTVLFTQGEVNSYLNLAYGPKLPKGVSGVDVRLERDRMTLKGLVNIDRVKGKVEGGTFSPLSFLSGDVPVEASGRLRGKDGFGQVEWEAVYVSSIRVPISALEQMVRSATKSEKNPEGFDILAPFRLPYSVNRLRLEPGRAFLDF
jgi:hypothetical protein